MTTAAPVSLSLSGRNTVSVGCDTFVTRITGFSPGLDSVAFSSPTSVLSPGALSGQTSMTTGLSAAAADRQPTMSAHPREHSIRFMNSPFFGCAEPAVGQVGRQNLAGVIVWQPGAGCAGLPEARCDPLAI